MQNKSVPLNLPIQFIQVEQINPLITKTVVKIMYTGKNRNGSYISKETAEKMATSLPNVPIVGEWSEENKDFLSHGEEQLHEGKLRTTTRPIGVVPSDTKIWWEKYLDNDSIEREYMCCEAYIWTGRYPETKKIFKDGVNNQSMELDSDTLRGSWAQIENKGKEYFIIEEAIFTALCVLGEDVEPCFEGASINPPFYQLIDTNTNHVVDEMALLKQELAEALSAYAKEKVTNFPKSGENKAITLRNSQWELFDPSFAAMIKEKHPDIWRLGGNIRGNSQYRKLSQALGKSSDDLSNTLKDAIKLREAWVARHYKDFRIAGVIAQIKWLAVGSRGQKYMKELVKEEIRKRRDRKRKFQKEVSYFMDEGVKDLITEEPTVEVEAEDMEQEISLKDMITEIVKEVMATMKSQVSEEEMNGEEMKEEEKEVEMVESEMKDKEEKYSAYESEIASLKAQLQVYENKEKMALIEKFSMLDASFLEGLKSSLDSYSIDQLEAKLSIEAVRSGLVFNSTKQEVRTYSVDSIKNDSAPSWVKILEKL
jgi:hypothetical protein